MSTLDSRISELNRKMDEMKKSKTDNTPEYTVLLRECLALNRERMSQFKVVTFGGKAMEVSSTGAGPNRGRI